MPSPVWIESASKRGKSGLAFLRRSVCVACDIVLFCSLRASWPSRVCIPSVQFGWVEVESGEERKMMRHFDALQGTERARKCALTLKH